mgnify:FL=1|tara:strand:- start:186 stop:1112 length:927 start_codon:yes stop_codon:yes gene_type:complete
MKKTLLYLILLFSVHFLVAQAYVPFPTSNASWKESVGCSIFDISIVDDTIINGLTYHTLVAHEKELHPVGNPPNCHPLGSFTMHYNLYFGAFRNDSVNKKVWFVPPGDTLDTLLYDFNLSVGDTLPIGYKYDPSVNRLFQDTITVVAIDSVNLGGVWRKRYALRHCPISGFNDIYIIEGIGSTQSLLENYYSCNYSNLLGVECTKENGVTIYPNSSYQCNVIVGLETTEIKKQEVKLYPNPTNGSIFITEHEQLERIQLFNIQGKLIKEIQPNRSSETVLNIEGSPGIYLIRLRMVDGSVTSSKVVKQ